VLSTAAITGEPDPATLGDALFTREAERRAQFASSGECAADAYIVARTSAGEPPGRTVIAGYPWFSDWGRDTFIALRGLCLSSATADYDRFADAREILLEWAEHVSEGMLPNLFPEVGRLPEYNSVDASLWYVIAVHEFLQLTQAERPLTASNRRALTMAVDAIVSGYARGTRFGIRADGTGLLSAGEKGVQLTWMDAKVGDWVVTPRIGKPVSLSLLPPSSKLDWYTATPL